MHACLSAAVVECILGFGNLPPPRCCVVICYLGSTASACTLRSIPSHLPMADRVSVILQYYRLIAPSRLCRNAKSMVNGYSMGYRE